jgi:hypothetical protein
VRRNPTIINLYDRPSFPRPSYSSRHLKPIEYPRPLWSYLVVAAALLYCAVYLAIGWYGRPLPAKPALLAHQRTGAVPILIAPEAPAPDMSSKDVRLAGADADAARASRVATSEPAKIAAKAPPSLPKKRKIHIVAKPKEENGSQAFAFSFADHRTHDAGF